MLRDRCALLEAENLRLKNICGDNLCWIRPVDADLIKVLPESEFLESCRRYRAQLAGGSGELAGGKTIAQLEEENARLRAELEAKT